MDDGQLRASLATFDARAAGHPFLEALLGGFKHRQVEYGQFGLHGSGALGGSFEAACTRDDQQKRVGGAQATDPFGDGRLAGSQPVPRRVPEGERNRKPSARH